MNKNRGLTHQLSPKTVIYHKNQIMEKYGLNNHYDFFQFISVLSVASGKRYSGRR